MERSIPVFSSYLLAILIPFLGHCIKLGIFVASLFFCCFSVHAVIFDVTVLTDTPPVSGFVNFVPGELRTAMSQATLNPGPHTIRFNLPAGGTITLNKALPAITQDLIIDHSVLFPATTLEINGAATYPIFFVYGTPSGTSALPITVGIIGGSSFTLRQGSAQGGTGGGAGMGAGGALFINAGMTVDVLNVDFDGNNARGGNAVVQGGLVVPYGGGGLIGGNGGIGDFPTLGAGGGGGVAGNGGPGGLVLNDGASGAIIGALSGGNSGSGTGGANGGGGAGVSNILPAGGGGVDGADGSAGGDGGFGGGGGGNSGPGVTGTGGMGGFGGGGGDGGTLGTGGAGGFGGGGGRGGASGGAGGYGGGTGGTTGGGGGAAFGGSAFARGNLSIASTHNTAFTGGTAIAGLGSGNGTNGTAEASDIYADTGVIITFLPGLGSTQTQNGTIGGPGGIRQIGAGNLVLNGVNTYLAGTLLGNGNPATSGFITVGTGSALGTGLLTFNAGTLQSNSPLILMNSFTLIAPSFIGGTNDLTLNPALSADLNANLLTVNNTAGVITLGGVPLTGTGGVTKTGDGTLLYTTAKTYTGLTTIEGGTLQAGVANMLPITNALTMTGGTFSLVTFNQTLGNFSGTAGTVNLGTATLTVGSDNSSSTFSGNIIGAGALNKIGTGTFTLTGINTYTGLTTVSAGRLHLTGSLADSVTVNAGAILSGTGTVLGAVVNNGTVHPGDINTIGTLSVGSYLQGPGATLAIEFNGAGQTDLLQVTGLSLVNGTVQFTPDPGAYFPGTVYTFLTASGSAGQFSTVTFTNNNLGPLQTQVIYNPNSIQLKISGPFNPDLPCLTPNQRSVVEYFNTLPFEAGTDLGEILIILAGLDPCGPNGPFEQISSAETAATYWVLADDIAQTHLVNTRRLDILRHFKKAKKRCEQAESQYAGDLPHSGYAAGDLWPKKITRRQRLQKRIQDKKRKQEQECMQVEQYLKKHLEHTTYTLSNTTKSNVFDACCIPEGDVWVRGFGGKYQQDTLPNSRGFGSKNNGFLLGMDFDIEEEWFFGFSGGKVFSHLDWRGNTDKAHLHTALGSLYASWYNDCGWYIDSSLVAGDTNYTVSRNLQFSTINRHALGNYRGFSISPYAGAGYVVDLDNSLDTEVFANVEYIDIRRNAYVEKGAGILDLAVRRKQVGFLRSEAGIGFTNLVENDIVSVLLKAKLSYVYKKQTQKGTLIAGLVGFPGNFAVTSYTQPKHQGAVGVGIYSQFCTSGFWSVFYDAEFGGNAMMHAGSARIGFLF